MTTTSCNLETREAICVRHGPAQDPDRLDRDHRVACDFAKSRIALGDMVRVEVRSAGRTRIMFVMGNRT